MTLLPSTELSSLLAPHSLSPGGGNEPEVAQGAQPRGGELGAGHEGGARDLGPGLQEEQDRGRKIGAGQQDQGLEQEGGPQDQGLGAEEGDLVPEDVRPGRDPGAVLVRGGRLVALPLSTRDPPCPPSCSTQPTDSSRVTPSGPPVSGRG